MSDFHRVQVIEALAGSGKTRQLARRYLRVIASGANPRDVLATTFSRAAAGEIRDRVLRALAEAVLDEGERADLAGDVPELAEAAACSAALDRLIAELPWIRIGTIDSFFMRAAQAYGAELGLSPAWSILDEAREQDVLADAVRRMTAAMASSSLARALHATRRESTRIDVHGAIDHVRRAVYPVARWSDQEAWTWLAPRKGEDGAAFAAAIDALGAYVTDKKSLRRGIDGDLARARAGDLDGLLSSGIGPKLLDGALTYNRVELDDDLQEIYAPILEHVAAVLTNRAVEQAEGVWTLLDGFHEHWSQAKHDRALYGFDDVTWYLAMQNLLEDTEELRYRLDGTIEHLLVDEFQDTSLQQWSVLRPIVDEINQSTGDRSLFFVGDVKQSLYGFRGGEPALLANLSGQLGTPHVSRMDRSWRCSPAVLDAVNQVFGAVGASSKLNDCVDGAAARWQEAFSEHGAGYANQPGLAEIVVTGEDGSDKAAAMVEAAATTVRRIHERAPAATIGVLVRGGQRQQIQRIVHALRSDEDMPILAAERRGNPLTDAPAVTLLLSALLLADHPGHSVAAFHVATSPLAAHLGMASMDDASSVAARLRRDCCDRGLSDMLAELAQVLAPSVPRRDRLRLWQLVTFAETTDEIATLRPADFVRRVESQRIADPVSSRVQVMTIHAAKGLEFDAVVLCDLQSPLWLSPDLLLERDDPCAAPVRACVYQPSRLDRIIPELVPMRRSTQERSIGEALCTLYVGMTRAKHALHMLIPPRPKAKSYQQTYDGVLRESLELDASLEPGTIAWRSSPSDEDWYDQDAVEDLRSAPPDPPSAAPTLHLRSGSGRRLASLSPSQLEGGDEISVRARCGGGRGKEIGTLVHHWLEEIIWAQDVPSEEELVATASQSPLPPEVVRTQASDLVSALASPDISALLTPGDGDTRVRNEQSFLLRLPAGTQLAGTTLEADMELGGTIDRLVVTCSDEGTPIAAHVIDWKSDAVDDDNREARIAFYVPQLAAYRFAAARMLDIDVSAVRASLCLLGHHEVVDVTQQASVG